MACFIFGIALNCATAIWNAPGMKAGLPSCASAKACSSFRLKRCVAAS